MIKVDQAENLNFSYTSEGYLKGKAVVSKTGVFDYLNSDGSIRKELRHPDDVFSKKSLKSLEMIPVTVDHPQTLLTLETATELSVGQTGENVFIDGKNIVAPFLISHKNGIEAVKKGKKQLSLGYSCDLLEENGVYNGEEYTHRQTNIVYNHLSLVGRARVGNRAKINLDGFSLQLEKTLGGNVSDKKLIAINLDGLEYEGSPEVKKRLDEVEKEKKDLKEKRDDLKKEYDALKAKLDAVKEELDGMKSQNSDEAISKKVQERISLERKALTLAPKESFDGIDQKTLMIKAIKNVRPNFDSKEKSLDYVSAAFDLALENHESGQKALEQQRKDSKTVVVSDQKDLRSEVKNSFLNMYKKRG